MFKTALDKTKRYFREIFKDLNNFLKKKPKLLFVAISLFSIILLVFVAYSYLKPKPNDDIFFLNTNNEAILGNKNPTFNVDFGKRDDPDTQWVRFEAKSSSKNPFEEKKENIFTKISNWVKPKKEYGIEMSLQGVNLSETEKLEVSDSSDIVKSVAEIIGTDDIKTSTELVESGRVIGEYTEEPVSKKTVVNKEVADGVDLEYQILEGLGLKEEIVIRDLEAYTKDCRDNLLECKLPLNEFIFDLALDDGLRLKKGWFLLNGVNTETYYFEDGEGNYVAHFLPNWAVDNIGNKTYDVMLDVEEKEEGGYRTIITVDINWLFGADRVYPVRIDPSIVHDTKAQFDEGVFDNIFVADGPKVEIVEGKGYSVDANTVGYWNFDESDITTSSGGTITYSGGYVIHTFTSTGTFTIDDAVTADVLVVAGGGGGGGSAGAGGGGGGGGVTYSTGVSVSAQSYTVTVGTGGAGTSTSGGSGASGNNSSFGALVTATGGGGGGGYNGSSTTAPRTGGSGGGGGSSASGTFTGANGTTGQGYRGGNGRASSGTSDQAGGGGGGASAQGVASTTTTGGHGGDGVSNSITGTAVTYAGGGGGGKRTTGSGMRAGSGGAGGGGNGGYAAAGSPGTNGLGGGGGGGGANAGGRGGDGVVIVRYLGTGLEDSSTNGNHGMPVGTTYVEGKSQGARYFDGTDDYFRTATLADISNGNTVHTIEAWIKPTSVPTTRQWPLLLGDASAGNHHWTFSSDGYLRVGVWNGEQCLIPTDINDWNHIAVVFDGTEIYCYKNGVLYNKRTATFNLSSVSLKLAQAQSSEAYFKGLIDEVRVSDIARTSKEIKRSYFNGLDRHVGTYISSDLQLEDGINQVDLSWVESGSHTGGGETPYSTTGLLAQWSFNETSGTTAASGGSCGSSCNGTLTNMTTTGQDAAPSTGWTSKYKRWGTGAVMFDGSDDRIDLAGQNQFALQTFSLESWFWLNDVSAERSIFGFPGTGGYKGYVLKVNSSGYIYFTTVSGAGASVDSVVDTNLAKPGMWYHVVVTVSQGSSIKMYVNGNLVNQDSSITDILYDATHYPQIGRQSGTNPNLFKGIIDVTKFYNRALTIDEIMSNYQSGNIEFQYRSNSGGGLWNNWLGGTETVIDNMDTSELDWDVIEGSILSIENDSSIRMKNDGSLKITGDYTSANAKWNRFGRTITGTNITSSTKIPFYFASDTLGADVELMVGESEHANYLTDTNTVGLWHLDEFSGTGAYFKDSSGNALDGTPSGTLSYSGILGLARNFEGSSDSITVSHNTALNITTNLSIEAWINPDSMDSSGSWNRIVEKGSDNQYGFSLSSQSGYGLIMRLYGTSTVSTYSYVIPTLGVWSHVAVTYDGSYVRFYLNGQLVSQTANTGSITTTTENLVIGNWTTATRGFDGRIDEVRISNKTRTDDEIKQAYEFNKRRYQVTVDFEADLQSSNLIANSDDKSFTISESSHGTTDEIENLSKWEKIIIKQSISGTEYIAQGTVNSLDIDTGAVTVSQWDAGSTFPSGGYTADATVFKWQEEFFDIRNTLSSHVDNITILTFRILTPELANYWIDDIKVAKYLTPEDVEESIDDVSKYFQYRAIFTAESESLSPWLSQVVVDYSQGNTGPSMDQIMRHGKWFTGGLRKNFWWANPR